MTANSSEQAFKDSDIQAWLSTNLPSWSLSGGCLCRTYRTSGWKATMMAANAVAHLAEAAWHHPEIHLSYASLEVRLSTHTAKGVTAKDYALASKIEDFVFWQPAKERGALEGTPNDDPSATYIKYHNA